METPKNCHVTLSHVFRVLVPLSMILPLIEEFLVHDEARCLDSNSRSSVGFFASLCFSCSSTMRQSVFNCDFFTIFKSTERKWTKTNPGEILPPGQAASLLFLTKSPARCEEFSLKSPFHTVHEYTSTSEPIYASTSVQIQF